jgi:hypothetical protein
MRPSNPRASIAAWTRSPRSKQRIATAPAVHATVRACHSQRGSSPRATRASWSRRISSMTTCTYRSAKPATAVSVRGARRRSIPATISGAVVVAARTPVARTASVALATIPHAVHSPSSESPTPSTSTRGPAVTNGSSTTNATNGTSMMSRRARKPAPARAQAARARTTARSTA